MTYIRTKPFPLLRHRPQCQEELQRGLVLDEPQGERLTILQKFKSILPLANVERFQFLPNIRIPHMTKFITSTTRNL